MPKTQTLGEMIKLGDLPLEQKEQISDAIKYSAEHEGEMYNQVSHAKLDANKTSMVFYRSYLPKIDKTSERYVNGLLEGVTPDPEQINEAEFSVSVIENGWYYKFTNKALNHAWLDIKARCSKFLANLFKTYHDEKIADAYLSSANTVTGLDPTNYKDLLRLKSILRKNGGTGEIYFKSNFEVIDAMVMAYRDLFEANKQNDVVIQGEVGKVAGIHLVTSRLQAFEKSGTNHPFICYCKNQSGEYPVTICAYDNMAEKVMVTPLGGLGNDPLKQRGAIGLYVDGHGFYVSDDSVCIRGLIAHSAISSQLSSLVPSTHFAHIGSDFNFLDADRSGKRAEGKARAITPQYDYVKINQYSSGITANTLVIKAFKEDGTEWQFGSDNGKLTIASGNTSVATVAVSSNVATLTTVDGGVVTLLLKQYDNEKITTVVTVEIIDSGVGSGVID